MKKLFVVIFVITCVSNIQGSVQFLHYVIDDVSAGSYKYYSLMYDGLIKIKLLSNSGDADIYVSQTTTKPTYEPDKYCLQSSTCGEDIIYIPENFKRPLSIGIYGHPSHESSHYTLLIYQVTNSSRTSGDQESENKEKTSIVLTLCKHILFFFLDLLFYVLTF